jgi:hypothetical protein
MQIFDTAASGAVSSSRLAVYINKRSISVTTFRGWRCERTDPRSQYPLMSMRGCYEPSTRRLSERLRRQDGLMFCARQAMTYW